MNDEEIWRPISGYENKYLISNHGRIKSLPRQGNRPKQECLKLYLSKQGYLKIRLYGPGKNFFVHRLVLMHFAAKPHPTRDEANHKDLVRTNNHISNLEWVTRLENAKHANRLNPKNHYGSRNYNSILTESDLPEICRLRKSGMTYYRISLLYGVSETTIADIFNRRSWSHINLQLDFTDPAYLATLRKAHGAFYKSTHR